MQFDAFRTAIAIGLTAFAQNAVYAQEEPDYGVVAGFEPIEKGKYPTVESMETVGVCVGYTYPIVLRVVNRYDLPPSSSGTLTPFEVRAFPVKYGRLELNRKIGDTIYEYHYTPEIWQPNAVESIKVAIRSPGQDDVGITISTRLRHCLDGTWRDYGVTSQRTIDLDQMVDVVEAKVTSGPTCGGQYTVKFSGRVDGDKLTVCNLIVCEPDECAQAAGRQERMMYSKEWKAKISPDGRTITGEWFQDYFDFIGPQGGPVTSCAINKKKSKYVTYTIKRDTSSFSGIPPKPLDTMLEASPPTDCPGG